MNSSISNSDSNAAPGGPGEWRRFARWFFGGGLGLGGFIALWIIIVDPFDTLFFSPPLDRVPIATNARFSFPALARSNKFDSAIIGTSTGRLLRPEMLDRLFAARFVNLAMNSATAYEQYRILELFARQHPSAKTLVMGIDVVWCETGATFEKYTPRPFPEWMYDSNAFNDVLHHYNLYTIEQAGRQFATMTGMRRLKYGRDGYTSFLPDAAGYDLAKVQKSFVTVRGNEAQRPKTPPGFDPATLNFPTHFMLRDGLKALPGAAKKIIFFAPYHVAQHPVAGTLKAAEWAECKARVTAIAGQVPNAITLDFMINSPFTTTDSNYWDVLHYTLAAADALMGDLALGANGGSSENFTVPKPPPAPDSDQQ